MTDKEIMEKMWVALDEIAFPIHYMNMEAQKNGSQLDGSMALKLAEDPNYLRNIAKKCIVSTPYHPNLELSKDE